MQVEPPAIRVDEAAFIDIFKGERSMGPTAEPKAVFDRAAAEEAVREELVRSGMPGNPTPLARRIVDRMLALVVH